MSEVSNTRWLRWTPAQDQRVTLRTGGSTELTQEVELLDLVLTLPEDDETPPGVQMTLRCDRATYLRIEALRWFDIPVGFSESIGADFSAEWPIDLTVALRPPERMGFPLKRFLENVAEDEALAKVVAPFIDAAAQGPANNPLFLEALRVTQTGPDGVGTGFDRAAIEAWEAGE